MVKKHLALLLFPLRAFPAFAQNDAGIVIRQLFGLISVGTLKNDEIIGAVKLFF